MASAAPVSEVFMDGVGGSRLLSPAVKSSSAVASGGLSAEDYSPEM